MDDSQRHSASQEPAADHSPKRILTVNPGSTSTKLALFEDDRCLKNHEVRHAHVSGLQGAALDREVDEYVKAIELFLRETGDAMLDAVVGRGGLLNREFARVESGVYEVASRVDGQVSVRQDIVRAVRDMAEMDHASNLGIPIAARLAERLGCPAYTVDPVVADDFEPVARYSGYAPIERRSIGHVLSIREMARRAAEQLDVPFERSRFVVVHIGGGITVAAVRDGRMVDNTPALLGEGPFTPQRAGTLPQKAVIDLCYSGRFTKEELCRELTKRAGLISYLGEDDIVAIERRIADGDRDAALAIEAMAYQIAKEIGAMSIAVGGDARAIVISGGMARSERIVGEIIRRTEHLAPIIVFPENVEMAAMARGALSVLRGEQRAKQYGPSPLSQESEKG